MTNKEMVIQHNDLISGRHNWSTNEIKIVLKSITEINENNLIVEFSKSDILTLTDDKDLNVNSSFLLALNALRFNNISKAVNYLDNAKNKTKSKKVKDKIERK